MLKVSHYYNVAL